MRHPMKLSRRKIGTFLGAAVIANVSQAQLPKLPGVGEKGGGGNIDADVKNFLDLSINIEKTLLSSSLAIIAAYQSEEERAKSQASYAEVQKTTEAKEAGAKFQAISESNKANMEKLSASSDFAEKTKNLSEAKQKQVAAGVFNFLIGALQAKDLLPTGQSIMQGATSNPMNITKVIPIKDAIPRLSTAMNLASTTIPKFVKVLQGANISIPNATSKSTPAEQPASI